MSFASNDISKQFCILVYFMLIVDFANDTTVRSTFGDWKQVVNEKCDITLQKSNSLHSFDPRLKSEHLGVLERLVIALCGGPACTQT